MPQGRCPATLCAAFIAACGGGGSPETTSAPPLTPAAGSRTGDLQVTDIGEPTEPAATPAGLPPFIAFESGQVKPLALSADGQQLYAVNTPDNRLEVFAITGQQLELVQSIPVGMEPVAVAVSGDEAWVVNHLSDSVSVVSFAAFPARVVKTLLVGDEPRDIVFAGPNMTRAFITTAHRGQNAPFNPHLTTPGIGRADVWVFDRNDTGSALGGRPVARLTLFGDTPRGLAASADGSKVYAAIFNSGNRTTVVRDIPTLQKAAPFANVEGEPAPLSALILKFDGSHWVDEAGRAFDSQAALNLPDIDVFEIDAMTDMPVETGRWSGVGTTLFNLVVHPLNGKLFVSNTEARNEVRFEGPGDSGSTVRGHFALSRISVLEDGGRVSPRHLNAHIDRDRPTGTEAERALSLALPLQMAISEDGARLYVAAMGSDKIGVLSVSQLENGSFDPALQTHIPVSGGGPTGIVLDRQRQQAYALTRFDNGISVIDLTSHLEVSHVQMHNPEPVSITQGRRFLYDATLTSSSGDSSCALCHVFGDTDHLSWDLGNPDATAVRNPFGPVPDTIPPTGPFTAKQVNFHPMKGPKATQSLRGMPNHGPMHWRGDRTGLDRVGGETQEAAAFKEFNVAFDTLLGRAEPLTDAQMQAFTDFALQLSYPPNPHRALNNSLNSDQREGHRVYTRVFTSPGRSVGCNTCHVLDVAKGRFGTAGSFTTVLAANEQDFKVPHFRNIYQKVGFFRGGASQPQIRGFGLSEPGSTAGLMALVNSGEFNFENDRQPRQLAEFIFAFDSLLAPIVGQQVTLSADAAPAVDNRLDLLFTRAQVTGEVPECDLIVKGVWAGEQRGALNVSGESFQTDRTGDVLSLSQLKLLAREPGNHLTFTCAPPNSGKRMAIDRNLDGVLDND